MMMNPTKMIRSISHSAMIMIIIMKMKPINVNGFVVGLSSISSSSFSSSSKGTTSSTSVLRSSTSSSSTTTTSTTTMNDTPITLPDFTSREEYIQYMERISTLPKGFGTGTADGTFVPVEAPLMGKLPIRGTIIYLTNGPTENWAAVYTSNKFPGAPVIVGRNRIANGSPLHAIVINNKVSNVCSGSDDSVADSEMVCQAVADALQLPGGANTVLPSSTGVIGWRLPAVELATDVVPKAITNIQTKSALNAAMAICTTDRWPKVRSATLSNGARIVGIAKGAGMIEPNMATMLSYIMTDATIPKDTLQSMLSDITNDSFNSISVDGDESTSDTLVLISSNQIPDTTTNDLLNEFRTKLEIVCKGLAADLVRNGEGTGHVMKVTINNFPGTNLQARRLGRHIVNSPLFKCAVSGNDPNTGRLAAAIGSFVGKYLSSNADDNNNNNNNNAVSVAELTLTLGGRCIFTKGKFALEGQEVEEELSQHMKLAQYNEHSDYPPHQKFVELGVDFGTTTGTTSNVVVYGSDLTAEYVAVNADYRS